MLLKEFIPIIDKYTTYSIHIHIKNKPSWYLICTLHTEYQDKDMAAQDRIVTVIGNTKIDHVSAYNGGVKGQLAIYLEDTISQGALKTYSDFIEGR